MLAWQRIEYIFPPYIETTTFAFTSVFIIILCYQPSVCTVLLLISDCLVKVLNVRLDSGAYTPPTPLRGYTYVTKCFIYHVHQGPRGDN